MPKSLIFVLVIFLIVVYVYTFIKWRKRRKMHGRSDIDAFKDRYVNKKSKDKYVDIPDDEIEDLRVDYMDKDEFYRSIQSEIHDKDIKTEGEKKFTLKF